MRHLIAAAALAATMPTALAATCQATSPKNTVALVELYTSQGCSSCPPADRWLSQLPARIDANRAVPLALHVGYWDYIGWKDPFAKREFNDRQSQLAALNRQPLPAIRPVFSYKGARRTGRPRLRSMRSCVRSINGLPRRQSRSTRSRRTAAKSACAPMRSWPHRNSAKNPRLIVALVQNGISTKVTAGENRGETLANDRVTRAWSGPLPLGTRTVSLEVPSTAARDLALVAFVEDDSGVLQALQLPLAGCS